MRITYAMYINSSFRPKHFFPFENLEFGSVTLWLLETVASLKTNACLWASYIAECWSPCLVNLRA